MPPGPVLEVGLQQEDGVAEAAVPGALLGAQAGHEVLGGRRGDAGAKLRQESVREVLVSQQEARVQERRRRRQIGRRQRQRLLERPHGVAGVDLGVPQRIEDRLGQRLRLRAGTVGAQHEKVEVRVRRQLAAAEPAGREDGDRLGTARDLGPRRRDYNVIDVGSQLTGDGDTVGAGPGGGSGARAGVGKLFRDLAHEANSNIALH